MCSTGFTRLRTQTKNKHDAGRLHKQGEYELVCAGVLHEDLEVVRDDAPIRFGADGDVERAHALAQSDRHDVRVLGRDLGCIAHDLLVERDGAAERGGVIARKRVNL